MDESLNNMIKKLQKSSDLSESRIREVESSLKSEVSSLMSKKLDELAETVEIEETLSRIESSSGKKVCWTAMFFKLYS